MSRTAVGSIAVARRSVKRSAWPWQWRSMRHVKLIASTASGQLNDKLTRRQGITEIQFCTAAPPWLSGEVSG